MRNACSIAPESVTKPRRGSIGGWPRCVPSRVRVELASGGSISRWVSTSGIRLPVGGALAPTHVALTGWSDKVSKYCKQYAALISTKDKLKQHIIDIPGAPASVILYKKWAAQRKRRQAHGQARRAIAGSLAAP